MTQMTRARVKGWLLIAAAFAGVWFGAREIWILGFTIFALMPLQVFFCREILEERGYPTWFAGFSLLLGPMGVLVVLGLPPLSFSDKLTTPFPPISAQLDAVERFLGRPLPEQLRNAYVSGLAKTLKLLPLATGREDEPSSGGSTAEQFNETQAKLDSVLGHAMGNASATSVGMDGHVWPPSLLVVEDYGCAIYRAVDLDDEHLRIVEYEYLDPVDDPEVAAGERRLAYSEPSVPRNVQHRFTVLADSLEQWLQRLSAS
ncbi:MAG TPA: hypothetical protein VM686_20150 [Polyangiaceae bacterium]|nr:hypothetical protein [Polyangiaceae bacterium]